MRRAICVQEMRTTVFGSLGMTLVEMMVAIGITSIMMVLSVSIFVGQQHSYQRGKNVKETQESGQAVMTILKTELMEAGWGVLPEMAFFFEDGGANAPDRIYLADPTIMQLSRQFEREIMLDNACASCRQITAGAGTNNITLQPYIVGAGVQLLLDLDDEEENGEAGDAEFVGGITQYVISDSGNDKVASIDMAAGNQLQLLQNLAGGFVAPAIFYCVDSAPVPDPMCTTGSSETDVLRRSDKDSRGLQPAAERIADLQVAYRDVNNVWYGASGCAGATCQLSPFDPREVSLIRVNILTKSQLSAGVSALDPAYCRPALENRVAAAVGSAECGFIYRVYSVELQPRSSGRLYADE